MHYKSRSGFLLYLSIAGTLISFGAQADSEENQGSYNQHFSPKIAFNAAKESLQIADFEKTGGIAAGVTRRKTEACGHFSAARKNYEQAQSWAMVMLKQEVSDSDASLWNNLKLDALKISKTAGQSIEAVNSRSKEIGCDTQLKTQNELDRLQLAVVQADVCRWIEPKGTRVFAELSQFEQQSRMNNATSAYQHYVEATPEEAEQYISGLKCKPSDLEDVGMARHAQLIALRKAAASKNATASVKKQKNECEAYFEAKRNADRLRSSSDLQDIKIRDSYLSMMNQLAASCETPKAYSAPKSASSGSGTLVN